MCIPSFPRNTPINLISGEMFRRPLNRDCVEAELHDRRFCSEGATSILPISRILSETHGSQTANACRGRRPTSPGQPRPAPGKPNTGHASSTRRTAWSTACSTPGAFRTRYAQGFGRDVEKMKEKPRRIHSLAQERRRQTDGNRRERRQSTAKARDAQGEAKVEKERAR